MVSEGVICPAAASCEQGEPAEKKKPVRTTTRVRISLVSTECENEKKKVYICCSFSAFQISSQISLVFAFNLQPYRKEFEECDYLSAKVM